jgi:hypothetical protein
MGQFSMEKPALKGQFSVEINTEITSGPHANRPRGDAYPGTITAQWNKRRTRARRHLFFPI